MLSFSIKTTTILLQDFYIQLLHSFYDTTQLFPTFQIFLTILLSLSIAFNYRENNIAHISCLLELNQKNNMTNFRLVFTFSLSCIDSQFSVSEEIVDIEDLPCQLVCNIGDLLPEPTEGLVGICTGSFCDFGASIGLKVTVTNINE